MYIHSYTAVATYSSARYRRHSGAELALQGARLRFSRANLAFQAPTCQAGMVLVCLLRLLYVFFCRVFSVHSSTFY